MYIYIHGYIYIQSTPALSRFTYGSPGSSWVFPWNVTTFFCGFSRYITVKNLVTGWESAADRPLKTEPQVESARPIAWNIDRRPDNSERQVLVQEPKYADRQITWGRVDCQSSIYLNTHVIQLPGYSTLDSTRTEQTARRACPCAIPSGVIAENRRSKCPSITANQRLSNSQTHEDV